MDVFGTAVAVVQTFSNFPGAIQSVKQLASGEPRGRAPGAEIAYLDFIDAASSVLYRLQLLASVGTPPRVVGFLWTWPAVYRSQRVFVDQSEAILKALGRIVMLGSSDSLIGAIGVAEAIGDVGSRWPSQRWVKDDEATMASLAAAGRLLGEFARAVHSEVAA